MIVKGKVRCPKTYADGTPSVEINFSKNHDSVLPVIPNKRAKIELKIAGSVYEAGISHTDKNRYIWINPDCYANGQKVLLSHLIMGAGFRKNDDISVDFEGQVATVITNVASPVYQGLPEEVDSPEKYPEGSVKTISVNSYERNANARRSCIEHYGTKCMVCGFDFAEVYGPEAEGFIHVHHLVPLSRIGESYEVDPIEDLRPVCPNCHAFIHLGGGFREIDSIALGG